MLKQMVYIATSEHQFLRDMMLHCHFLSLACPKLLCCLSTILDSARIVEVCMDQRESSRQKM
jgi:hypothetical protein